MPRDLDDPTDQWWTIEQAAAHFGVKPETVRDYARSDRVTVIGKRGHRLINRDQLVQEFRRRARAIVANWYTSR